MYLYCSPGSGLLFVHQVCPEMNTVMINIGLLLLAFSVSDEEHCRYLFPVYFILIHLFNLITWNFQSYKNICWRHFILFIAIFFYCFSYFRPNTYHSNLQVSWDLNTGVCCTVGVGDLTEVKGQTRWAGISHTSVWLIKLWTDVLIPVSLSVGACGALTGSPAWTRWWSGWFPRAAPATSTAWPTKLCTKVSAQGGRQDM